MGCISMLTFRWIENYLEQFSLVNHILTYIIYSETSSTYIWCRAMWQELKIKLNVDPVGLSALLEALKARVTSVLKFERADFMGGTESWYFPVYCLFCLIFFFEIKESWLKPVCFESATMAIFRSACALILRQFINYIFSST